MKRTLSFAVLILLLAVNITTLIPNTGGELEGWSEDIRLTYTYGRSVGPAIAVEGDNVHVVYEDNETGGKYQMFPWYVRSTDGGNTWSTPICLNNSSQTDVVLPRIAVSGNNIHVIWLEGYEKKIHYLKSSDNGNSWNSEKSISSTVFYYSDNWDIEVCDNNLHVIYINSEKKLSYIHSNDNGSTWSSPKILMPTVNQVIESALSVEGTNIHIAVSVNIKISGTSTRNIFYIRSTDNGVNWDSEININEIMGIHDFSVSPDIAASGNNIHVIFRWQISGTAQVYYVYSDDNGMNWENGGILSNNIGYVVNPTIDAQDNVIFIVWTENGVWYKYSNDLGNSWPEDKRITNSPGSIPDLTIYGNTVHFTWNSNNEGNWEIYYKRCSLLSPTINALVNIDPNTLNLKNKGRWITAYIELSEDYNVIDINTSSILLQNSIPVEPHPSEIGDYDNDGIPDLMVKFDRSSVEDILSPGKWVLILTGLLSDSTAFEGNDTIKVISPP